MPCILAVPLAPLSFQMEGPAREGTRYSAMIVTHGQRSCKNQNRRPNGTLSAALGNLAGLTRATCLTTRRLNSPPSGTHSPSSPERLCAMLDRCNAPRSPTGPVSVRIHKGSMFPVGNRLSERMLQSPFNTQNGPFSQRQNRHYYWRRFRYVGV